MALREKQFIAAILAEINDDEMEEVCRAQIEYYFEIQKHTLPTCRTYISQCRKALRRIDPKHPALDFMKVPEDKEAEYRAYESDRVDTVGHHQIHFDYHLFIKRSAAWIDGFLAGDHRSLVKASLGLAAVTGRRIYSEIMMVGRFEPVGPRSDNLLFSGQCKTRGRGHLPYKIPVLIKPAKAYEAWRLLCEKKEAFLKGKVVPEEIKEIVLHAHQMTAQEHYEAHIAQENDESGALAELISRRKRAAAVEAKKLTMAHYRGVILHNEVKPKDLRGMYAQTCFHIRTRRNTTGIPFVGRILGHGKKDTSVTQAYQQYKPIEEEIE